MNYTQEITSLPDAYETYLSYIDILGFTNFTLNNPHSEIRALSPSIRYSIDCTIAEVNHQLTNSSLGSTNENGILEPNINNSPLNCLTVSDSIILWTKSKTENDLLAILTITRNLLARLISLGFPGRGAISQGNITFNNGLRQNDSGIMHLLLLGDAITKAVKLEKIQLWSGCIIDPEITNNLTGLEILVKNNLIVRYDAPCKKEHGNQNSYAINWPLGLAPQDVGSLTPEKIRSAFNDYGKGNLPNHKIENMIDTTIQFLNFCKNKKQ